MILFKVMSFYFLIVYLLDNFAMRALLAFLQLDSRKHSGVISFFDKYFVKTGIFRKEFSKIVHKSFDFRQVQCTRKSLVPYCVQLIVYKSCGFKPTLM